MLDVKAILSMLASNIRKTGLPVPASESVIYEWSRGLGLEKRGDALLYTGGLYQLLPYINAYASQLEKLEGKRGSSLLLRAAGKFGRLAGAVVRPSKSDVEYSHRILRNIVGLLELAGVSVAYDPGRDGYSGVLLYDMGLDSAFKSHLERVVARLEDSGAEKIVTIDPHTTHVLRSVAPGVLDRSPSFKVYSYLEVLADNIDKLPRVPGSGDAESVVIHDPCLYARREGIIEQQRLLLERAGYKVVEPRRSGKLTYCCGGPIESIAPRLSHRIALRRVSELAGTGADTAVVMCPICLANLRRAASLHGRLRIEDLSIVVGERMLHD